eukprot:12914963-Prorocentrum_lima.AAC.1
MEPKFHMLLLVAHLQFPRWLLVCLLVCVSWFLVLASPCTSPSAASPSPSLKWAHLQLPIHLQRHRSF